MAMAFCNNCFQEFRTKINRGRITKYCSSKCYWINMKGKSHGHKTRNGMIAWNKGLKVPQLRGIYHGNWKNDDVSYGALHSWVRRELGKIKECVYCSNEDRIEWASISHKAKRDLNDYFPLCVPCHRDYDKKARV